MMQPLASKLALDVTGAAGPPSEVSQAVSMEGNNAAQVTVTVFRYTLTDGFTIQLQDSNDLESWVDKGSPQTLSGEGFTRVAKVTGIATAFVRVKYACVSAVSGIAILAADINLSSQ